MKKLIVALLISGSVGQALACTAVDIQAKDGSVVAGRTMEWAYAMDWQLIYSPKGSVYNLSAPAQLSSKPIPVKSKYALFGIGTALENDALLEGQNSAGLALSGNFLPGFTQYSTVTKKDKKYLSVLDFGKFVLGNFATVAEVKSELPKYKVWAPEIKNLPVEPSIHFMISDKSGQTVVVEFINGEMRLFDQTAQVLTNSPTYDWHMINIRNYLNLSNVAVQQRDSGHGTNVTQFGQGGGAIGLPGDYTPPSRFVKTTFLKHFASVPNDAAGAVELTGHILNNVDIPIGVVAGSSNGATDSDYTQWVAIKDISHNQFYFSDYNHRLNFVKIDLNSIFAKNSAFSLPIEQIKYPNSDISATLP
jgi:choloylglycine hydrolase